MKNFDKLTEPELICALSVDINQDIFLNKLSSQTLINTFKQIHEKLFFDTHGYDLPQYKPGFIPSDKIERLGSLIDSLVNDITTFTLSAIANFYHDTMLLAPFEYGNNITLRIFIYKLSKFLGINFDFSTVENDTTLTSDDASTIIKMPESASNSNRSNNKIKVIHKWPKWPSAAFKYKGKSFLCYNKEYLVAMDGTLCPTQDISKIENDYYTIDAQKYDHRLLPLKISETVDGVPLDTKKVPLINLDEDILTGLSISKELPILINTIHRSNISLLELPEQVNEIIDLHSSGLLKLVVTKAVKRLLHTREFIKKLTNKSFIGKQPTDRPNFFMTMGGSGSGKGLLKGIALKATESNLVEASLDKSRYLSFIYKLLIACEHHNDDYKIITQFAYTLRDSILNHALSEDYNLLFDGSGIPYRGRYEHLTEIFKNSGFKTHILVAETPFYHNHSNNRGVDSYHKIINRFRGTKDHRALPWEVAIAKHAGQPRSQLDAASDINAHVFIMLDTLPKKKDTYILATTQNISKDILDKMNMLRNNRVKLLEFILERQLLPDSALDIITADKIDFLVTAMLSSEIYKVLLITNKYRFLESLKKCLLNKNSLGKEDLFINSFPYIIPALDFNFRYNER